jgi:hypothetical protein
MFMRIVRHMGRNTVAYLALFAALGGGATAATNYIQATDTIPAGDLAGSTYGDPLIATGKVGTSQLADGSVTTAKFALNATAPNAAALGGTPASAFVRGPGQYAADSAVDVSGGNGVRGSGGQAFLFIDTSTLAGPFAGYYVLGDCNDSNDPGSIRMALGSYAFESAQVWTQVAGSAPTYKTFAQGAGGDFALGPTARLDSGIQRVTWHVLRPGGGVVTLSAWDRSDGSTCTFSAEGTRSGS